MQQDATRPDGERVAGLLDRHAAGHAAAVEVGEAVWGSGRPYLCPNAALAVLRWRRAMAGQGCAGTIRFELFARAFYLGSNASYVARQLAGHGLVEKWCSPNDRRAAMIRLTEAGLAWCDEMAELLGDGPFRPVVQETVSAFRARAPGYVAGDAPGAVAA